MVKTNVVTKYLYAYSISHALVDACSIILVLGAFKNNPNQFLLIIAYNVLAFGLQAPFGILSDKIKKPHLTAVFGGLFLLAAVLSSRLPILATIFIGVGNALFHVGGGTISLNLKPRRAAMPGVFVSTGAIGLFAGGYVAKLYGFIPTVFVSLLFAMTIVLFLLKSPEINDQKQTKTKKGNLFLMFVILILLSICIRSLVGLSLNYPWKSDVGLSFTLVLCIAFGKGVGGFISDYFGWIKTTVFGLLIASILLFVGDKFIAAGLVGLLLFNVTMPVTLVALSNSMPGRPGYAFGLTTAALLLGAFPTFNNLWPGLSNPYFLFLFTVLSAVVLFVALKIYFIKYD